MSSLERLIEVLNTRIEANDPSIRGIKYPGLLTSSLGELNSMIGMDSLKASVSLQTMTLIQAINSDEKNLGMLNTILYGPPGVGKTKVATILAKIWYSLGYLDRGRQSSEWSTSFKDASSDDINLIVVIAVLFFTYLISACQFIYSTLGMYWSIIILLFVLAVALALVWRYGPTSEDEVVMNATRGGDDSGVDSDSIISIVSRKDFVGGYVGQTAIKTKKLLQANLGKVLFIDEAYSLLNDARDPFGMEALTTLNLFMSEHEDDIGIMFAGYKDKMQHGIFRAQPGLPRRCMWHFECQRYTGSELAEIFTQQMERCGWKIEDKRTLSDIITNHPHLFPSYGGDTKRLGFFSQLEASQDSFFEGRGRSKVLTNDHIISGMKRLRDNNIHRDPIAMSPEYNDPDIEALKKIASLVGTNKV